MRNLYRKYRKTILVTLFVLVVLGGTFLWKTSGIPVYQNDRYGFAFSYPKGYVLTEREVGNGERGHYAITLVREEDSIPVENGEGPTAITVDVYQNNLDNLTLLQWLTGTNQSNFKLSDGTYDTAEVDGVGAVAYSWSGLYEGKTVAVRHKDSIIAFSGTYLAPSDKIIGDFDLVVRSVKFSR
jgi:hypothetical protein